MTRITVWNENRHEKKNPVVAGIYPDGIHGAIAKALRAGGLEVRTATLDEPEHGLTKAVLEQTDVLSWWGHLAHGDVSWGQDKSERTPRGAPYRPTCATRQRVDDGWRELHPKGTAAHNGECPLLSNYPEIVGWRP